MHRIIFLILLTGCFIFGFPHGVKGEEKWKHILSFAEWGGGVHIGNHTPFWQVSNRHGASSLDNNIYLRGGIFYQDSIKRWKLHGGIDLIVSSGYTSTFIVQQAYAEALNKWILLRIGSKEFSSTLLNQKLSSGGTTWSGNARPIPQVLISTSDYLQILPRLALKAEISYGWFTDNSYQKERVGEHYWYTRSIKYHHKAGFLRIGIPKGRWQFDFGMSLDAQFGGYKVGGEDSGDLGNRFSDYLKVFFPQSGDESSPLGEQLNYQGNFVGSEHFRLTFRERCFSLSAYLENYYDDFSGMFKQNGWDGLWGIEYRSHSSQLVNSVVIEYYQTTNQSGPLHGLDFSSMKKTGGADDYYNNVWYPGWVHWGQGMGNPFVASPIYNKHGDMTFRMNRVKALHMGLTGDINRTWSYLAKMSFSRTWGTPFKPTLDILENFSTFASVSYRPKQWQGLTLTASFALDMGEIYGDNAGFELKLHKRF